MAAAADAAMKTRAASSFQGVAVVLISYEMVGSRSSSAERQWKSSRMPDGRRMRGRTPPKKPPPATRSRSNSFERGKRHNTSSEDGSV